MKEIGGFLEVEHLADRPYYAEAIRLNTARNALVYLVKAKKISKVYLPYYLCSSVCDVCERENIPHEFYHIDGNFLPLLDKTPGDSEYVYIVNYYGQLNKKQIKSYQARYKNIIVDNVQAFFTKPVKNVDTIYSCRKFFGVPDGAYLISNAPVLPLDTDISFERAKHISGRYDRGTASDYYADFQKNEAVFDTLPPMYMSRFTSNMLNAIDYTSVIKKREQNWRILDKVLKHQNLLHLQTPKAPYMYPFYATNGKSLKQKLLERKIYIPTLWPNVLKSDSSESEKNYAENILPLPIDQRYTPEDMKLLAETLLSFLQ